MALPIRPNSTTVPKPVEVQKAPAQAQPTERPLPSPETLQQRKAKMTPSEKEVPEGWARDPKTGKVYKIIPKSEYDSEGAPILHLDDLNLDDLNSEATKYLGHLRVPPNKAEQKALIAEKRRKLQEQNTEYKRLNKDFI